MACPGAKLNPLASEFIWHGNKTGHMRVTEKGVSAKNANQVEVPEKNILTKDTEQDEEQNIWRLNKNSDFPLRTAPHRRSTSRAPKIYRIIFIFLMPDSCQRNLVSHTATQQSASESPTKISHQISRLEDFDEGNFKNKTQLTSRKCAKAAKEKESEVEYKNPCYINIKFTTTGGISYDLYHPLISYLNKPARRAFDHLQHLTYHNNQEFQTVKFRVDVSPEKINNAAYFLEALVNLSKHLPSSKPYNAYCAHGNDPRIKYSQQVPHLLLQYKQIKRLREVPAGIRIRRVRSTIMAHVRPDPEHLKNNLLPMEIKRTEIILPELTDNKLTVRVPQISGPADTE
ncbi:hypothetical protein M747DRAFT_316694 [Aspergillus niger ATCC 13496]|uniref:Contig An12c0110, genomic contig n=3 Tax=Aspergillus niger TaxID=5061 RepID=A2QZ60_ASPNC|nr:uncharacterized protein An12g03740 [Aspergillus niger]RDH18027.1 hypothetical protein M747DRAFT_316694 [Aspergillus niger ATCC 13496]CAK46145.1 unnamed protein product [Aspergillus niger]